MIYFVALIPATALTIGGYFVFFLANRSEGAFRTFGKYLGFWAFTLAALVILGAIFAAAHGSHDRRMFGGRGMYGRMHGGWPGCANPQTPAGASNPASAPGSESPSPH